MMKKDRKREREREGERQRYRKLERGRKGDEKLQMLFELLIITKFIYSLIF